MEGWSICDALGGHNSRYIVTFGAERSCIFYDIYIYMLGVVVVKFLMFTPTWGNDPVWLICFSNGLKPPSICILYSMFVCEEMDHGYACTMKTIVDQWVCTTLSLKQRWHELVYWNLLTCSNWFNFLGRFESNTATSHEEEKTTNWLNFSRCSSGRFRTVDPQSITIQITLHVFSLFYSYRIHADVWYSYRNVYHNIQLNVGKYTIHGWYGTVSEKIGLNLDTAEIIASSSWRRWTSLSTMLCRCQLGFIYFWSAR